MLSLVERACSMRVYIISSVMHTFRLVLTYYLLEDRRIDDVIIKLFLILFYIKEIGSKLPCTCSVIDHKGRQNVVRTKTLTLNPKQLLGIYLLNRVYNKVRI